MGARQSIVIYDESGQRVFANTSGRLLVDAAGVSVSASGIALSVSGNAVYLVSGQNIVNASGATVIALISGQTVVGDFTADTSGSTIYLISGNNNVQMSGQVVYEHGSTLITNPMTQVTSDSGGVFLSSGAVFSVTINNESGNSPLWIGGTGTQAPFSGKGLHVYGGGSVSLRIDSVDDIRVFGETSGQFVSWLGVQK